MNRLNLDRVLVALGGEVFFARGTGDVIYFHPMLGRPVKANSRRKDATRALTSYVLRLIRAQNEDAANDPEF
jgi:hypothetical protein